jgi:hypothetical protein
VVTTKIKCLCKKLLYVVVTTKIKCLCKKLLYVVVTTYSRSIPKEAFAESLQKLYERFQQCVVKEDDYFEG